MERAEAIEVLEKELSIETTYGHQRFVDAFKLAIAALREQEQSQWISVKEQPPEQFVSVLCYCPSKDYGTKVVISYNECKEGAYFADQHWYGEITHWMPLPEPPKEGAEE